LGVVAETMQGVKLAFDAMQEFVEERTGNELAKYMVAGESKVQ
jgi:hypothetical protein